MTEDSGIQDKGTATADEAARAPSGPAAGGEGGTSVLDQDEIDTLLGVGGGDETRALSGIESILNSALVSYERLPIAKE
jgi:flagellar motor switch protein FliM